MRGGEAVLKELARLASRAILYRQSGLALRLQRAGDGLGDELDEEEEINQQANIPYTVYPVRCHRHRIPRVQSCLGASNEGCLSVAGRRMRCGCRSTRADR
jgi:hypothetical protein